MNISERIRLVRGRQTREQFSEGTGISAQTLYKYEKQLSTPSIEFVDLICKKFKIDYRWLIAGDGPMHPGEEPTATVQQPEQEQPTEMTGTTPCARCEKLESKLEKVENQRDELAEENRKLLKENGLLREENATLRERQRKEQASLFDERKRATSSNLLHQSLPD